MNKEIKTKDIVESLRSCASDETYCGTNCIYNYKYPECENALLRLAADRLEELSHQHLKPQHNNVE